MDLRKQKIQKAAKEALEIKKNEKEMKINIKIVEANINNSKRKIVELYQQMNKNNENIEEYFQLEKDIHDSQNKLLKHLLIAGIIASAAFMISGFNFMVGGIAITIVFGILAYRFYDLNNKKEAKRIISEISEIKSQDSIDLKNKMEEKNKEIKRTILHEENKKRKLERQRGKLEKEKQQKDEKYQNLTDTIKNLTKERTELADALLKEHDSPVLDLKSPLYKGKRIK